jgi:SAM-dependent methyltransferase
MSEKIVCPNCKSMFNKDDPQKWVCGNCGFTVPLLDGKPVFSGHPDDQIPQEKIERGAEKGTAWRQFNWQFITAVASSLPEGADILDVGAGRGDFKAIFSRQAYLGLDIYPYAETDLSVDLIEVCPFQPASFDLIVLANVLEHVYEYRKLVSVCAALLKPAANCWSLYHFCSNFIRSQLTFTVTRATRWKTLQWKMGCSLKP